MEMRRRWHSFERLVLLALLLSIWLMLRPFPTTSLNGVTAAAPREESSSQSSETDFNNGPRIMSMFAETEPKVIKFRFDYSQRYKNRSAPIYRTLVRNKPTGHGFGSFYNLVLMAFQYSQLDGVDRLLHLNTERFEYGRLQDFFYPPEVMSENGSMPVEFDFDAYSAALIEQRDGDTWGSVFTAGAEGVDWERLKVEYYLLDPELFDPNAFNSPPGGYKLIAKETNEPRDLIIGVQHETGADYLTVSSDYTGVLSQSYHRGEIIRQRRLLCQLLWEPLPYIRADIDWLVARIRQHIGQGSWVTVHARRGDKINWESGDYNQQQYIAQVEDIIMNGVDPDLKRVLLISDDEAYLEPMKRGLETSPYVGSGKLKVFIINDLFRELFEGQRKGGNAKYIPPAIRHLFLDSDDDRGHEDHLAKSGWDQDNLEHAHKRAAMWHTRKLIISITLMALSDYTVCTYSSNMCRLVQVIRTQPYSTVYGVDGIWGAH